MSGVSLRSVPIGDCVDNIKTWNPLSESAVISFHYIDIASVCQVEKKIILNGAILSSNAPTRARQLVQAGDVLVSTVRPNLNAVAIVEEDLDGATASTGFCVLRPKPGILHPRYLFHWVRTTSFIADMSKQATGQSYPAVSDWIVKASRLPLPSFADQRRIAAILDTADALRGKQRATLEKLDQLGQAIFVDMFGDSLSNPNCWADRIKLGDVAEIVSGITKGRPINGARVRDVPYLAVMNVQDRHLNLETVKSISATEEEITRYRLEDGDLLLTEGGDPDKLGRGTLWNCEIEECIHQNHVFRVRLHDDRLDPLYLNWLVGSVRGKKYFLKSAKQTTGIASINKSQLSNFPLLLPPKKLQIAFKTRMKEVEALTAKAEATLARTTELMASLQHRAFRGEL